MPVVEHDCPLTLLELREHIFEALDNAVDNGYDPRHNSIEVSIVGLLMFDYECEHLTGTEIRPHVVAWFESHPFH